MTAVAVISATGLTFLFCYVFLSKYYTRHTYSPRKAKHRHPHNIRSNRTGRHRAETVTTGEILGHAKYALQNSIEGVVAPNEGRPTY